MEEGARPDTRESKRLRNDTPRAMSPPSSAPPPMLPDIGALRGGSMTGGDLGWDEKAFKRDIVT